MMAKDYDDEIDLDQTGGFGKDAVAKAAKRPTHRSTEGQVDERDRRQEAQASMAKSAAPKKQSFGQAFAAARKAGDKTFTFGGKKFNTELKEEAQKPATKRYMDKKSDDDLAYRAPRMGDAGFMAKRMTPDEVKAESMRNKLNAVYGEGSFKKGGMVKSSASKRADGCAVRGKTRGRMV